MPYNNTTNARISPKGHLDLLSRQEGIIPALESAHAVAYAVKRAGELGTDRILVVNLSGRGDKDMDNINQYRNRKNGQNC